MKSIKLFSNENNSCMINNLQVKYSQLNSKKVMDIINSLILKKRKINSAMHMDGGIDKIIELLNSYGHSINLDDLIVLIDIDNETKEKIKKIIKIIKITKMNKINIYFDIIRNNLELKEMLVDLQENLSHGNND